jgi:hypothetical protein
MKSADSSQATFKGSPSNNNDISKWEITEAEDRDENKSEPQSTPYRSTTTTISVLSKKNIEKINKLSLHSELDLPHDDSSKLIYEGDAILNEIRVKTMYKMVEQCKVYYGGDEMTKKILYLTNQQSDMLNGNEDAMRRCIKALNLRDSKLVIILLGSCGVRTQMMYAHPEMENNPRSEFIGGTYLSSELNVNDASITETQMLLFMQTIILPLAIKTKALIIVNGANDCSLSSSLATVALAEQARLGENCPFTVVAMACEYEVHYKAVLEIEKDSLASQICRGSLSWKSRIPVLNKLKYDSEGIHTLQRCDLNPSASTYIIFEAMDKDGNEDGSNMHQFQSLFTQCMTKDLPSIAIQAYHLDSARIPSLVDLLKRKVPVLLLDTSERTFSNVSRAGPCVTQLAIESNAYPTIPKSLAKKILADMLSNGSLTLSARKLLLQIAEDMLDKRYNVLSTHGVYDSYSTSLYAFIHSVVTIGTDDNPRNSSNMPLHEAIARLRRKERSNNDAKHVAIPEELLQLSVEYILRNVRAMTDEALLNVVSNWLSNCGANHELRAEAIHWQEKCKKTCADNEKNKGAIKKSSDFLDLMNLFSDPRTFSGSIHNCKELREKINSVAKIDRLPTSNSLEALMAIQDAWDNIENYKSAAAYYKITAKVTFLLILLIGIAVTVISVIGLQPNMNLNSRAYILALGFASTAVMGYITYVNPVARWQAFRVAGLDTETNLWMFRTRVGPYQIQQGISDDGPDAVFVAELRNIKNVLLDTADTKGTEFFSQSKSQNLHGQHATTNRFIDVLEAFDFDT